MYPRRLAVAKTTTTTATTTTTGISVDRFGLLPHPTVHLPMSLVTHASLVVTVRFVSAVPYKLITSGSCPSNGMVTIISEDGCKAAAMALGLWEQRTETTSTVYISKVTQPRPEGCYWYSQAKPVLKDIVLGVNPTHHKGRGAETSTEGKDRHPICTNVGK